MDDFKQSKKEQKAERDRERSEFRSLADEQLKHLNKRTDLMDRLMSKEYAHALVEKARLAESDLRQKSVSKRALFLLDIEKQIADGIKNRNVTALEYQDLLEQAEEAGIRITKQFEKQLQLTAENSKNISGVVDKYKQMEDSIDEAKAGVKSWVDSAKAIFLNPTVALIAGLILVGKYLWDSWKASVDLNKELGVGIVQAGKMKLQADGIALSLKHMGAESSEVMTIQKDLISSFGSVDKITQGLVRNLTEISVRYGVAAGDVVKLQTTMEKVVGLSEEMAVNTIQYAGQLARANGVAPSDVMSDIASHTELFALHSDDGGKNILKAAVQARKLGIELSTVNSMMEAMLDIETSIENEMELSVLTGKRISFETARQLALQNDLAGMQNEILKQVGSIDDFNRMGFIAQKKFAESLGMSVEDLKKAVSGQGKLVRDAAGELAVAEDDINKVSVGWTNFTNVLKGLYQFVSSNFVTIVAVITAVWVAWKTLGGVIKRSNVGKAIGKSIKSMFEPFSQISYKDLAKGALALGILSGSVYLFSLAMKEFTNVGWGDVGKAIVSMFALTGALFALGAIMTSGVGAVAILAGAAAMVVIAGSIWILGKAIQEVAKGFGMLGGIVETLSNLSSVISPLIIMIPSMLALSVALGTLGLSMVSLAAGLALVSPMLPVITALSKLNVGIGSVLSRSDETPSNTTASSTSSMDDTKIVEKLDELINLVKNKKSTINMDGRKVGEAVALAFE